MKKLFCLIPVVLVTSGWLFGKYGSMREAQIACDEWADKREILLRRPLRTSAPLKTDDCSKHKGTTRMWLYCIEGNKFINSVNHDQEMHNLFSRVGTRKCKFEKETRQFLGYGGYFNKNPEDKYIGDIEGTWKIRKRFKY